MIRALEADIALDMRPVLRQLQARQIAFHVTEESGQQVVWVRYPEEARLAQDLMAAWRDSGYPAAAQSAQGADLRAILPFKELFNALLRAIYTAPVTLLLVAACLLVALISAGGADLSAVSALFYPAFIPGNGNTPAILALLAQIDGPGVLLQTFSPALLHFGIIHLVFNMLWLWYLGRMIESSLPFWLYLLLLFFLAFSSNTVQFLMNWQNNFGGMSGVVYGLLGFIWSWQILNPGHRLRLPPAMIGFFLLALVLMEVFASSWIATAAHVGGLFGGVLAGLIIGLLMGRSRRPGENR
ncbi:MAG: rhomboid family intramembrane serine protease [Pseudomonadales bacterium]|nr:rhomboid family intramembrane serine protease [Pseudomonadales bacterium]